MSGEFLRSCRCALGVLLLAAGTFASRPAPVGAQSVAADSQRCITARAGTAGADVVVFQSGVLSEDVTFAGETLARVAFSTTGTDADVVVKLIDVYSPDEPNHRFHADTSTRLAGYQQLVRGENGSRLEATILR